MLIVDNTYSQTLASSTSAILDLKDMDGCCISATYSNATTAAKTFAPGAVTAATDRVTITAHGQVLGSKGQLTTATTLPAGLSLATDYFIIRIDADTVKFATSLANAVAGTAVDITDAGTGTHTFTPTTSTSNVLKLQAGNDGTNFEDLSGKTVTISTTTGATTVWDLGDSIRYRYVKILYTPSAGQIAVNINTSYNNRR